jgi:flagellar protein FlaJ
MDYKKLSIEKIAYAKFGKYYREKKEKFTELNKALLAARYPVTYDIYMSNAFLYSVIAGVLGLLVGFALANVLAAIGAIPIDYTVFPSLVREHARILGTIFLSAVGFGALFGITYALFYMYPSMRAGDRKREIDRMMPHAVHFMYALSKSGVGILNMVKSLAMHVDTYGEIGKEMDFVARNVEYFGKDLSRSLIDLSETTPSLILRGFISGILTVIESGGDIQIFLAEKVEQYTEHARVEQKSFLETLGLLAEVYITLIVAAPLFFIIVQIIMLAMGSGSITMIYGIVYAMIPLGSGMFIFMIYLITPSDVKKVAVLKSEFEIKKDHMETEEVKESGIYKDFRKTEKRLMVREYMKKPFAKMWENPTFSLVLSAPAALALFFLSGMTLYIPALLVALVPLTIFHESKSKYERRVRNQTPDVLRSMSSSVASGLTLMKTIEVTANAGTVGIYKEVKKMHRGLEWGAEVSDAFRRFANAVKISSLIRAVTLLTEVLRTGGNMPEALGISARDAEVERTLVKERSVNMLIYIIIIYIAFFIFIAIIYMMFTSLLPPLFESFQSTSSFGGSGIPTGGGISKDELSMLLSQAAMFQSIFCGLMAGQMGEGNILSGLKHVLIMLFVTWLLFTFFL